MGSGALVEASNDLVMRALVAGDQYGQEKRLSWLHRLPLAQRRDTNYGATNVMRSLAC
jgi:hypothetical protein